MSKTEFFSLVLLGLLGEAISAVRRGAAWFGRALDRAWDWHGLGDRVDAIVMYPFVFLLETIESIEFLLGLWRRS